MSPAADPAARGEIAALLCAAGVAPIEDMGWIRVTGPDRVRWLNGMVTNSIQALSPGQGCYCFVLNAQGRIQGDLTAFALADALLLETTEAAKIATVLDQFIIMDDVELTVLSLSRREAEMPHDARPAGIERAGLMLAGPEAPALLAGLNLPVTPGLSLTAAGWEGRPVEIVHAHSPLVPHFELWAEPDAFEQIAEALTGRGAARVRSAAFEQLRLLEGTPRYGVDIRNSETARDLPQETGQTRALHFNKGCYLGQEIVERIRSRGQVHRAYGGFQLSGELPAPGTALEAEGKPVGELTSVAAIEHPAAGHIQIALGYLRREALERGVPLTYLGGSAVPIPLPYTRA